MFKRSTVEPESWRLSGRFFSSDGVEGDDFGQALSMSDDFAVVSATADPGDNGISFGSVYVFRILKRDPDSRYP
jgi:hypothetical protein